MKIVNYLTMATMVAIALFSCKSKDTWVETKDENNIVQEKKPIWKTSNTSNSKLAGGVASQTLIINNNILDTYTDIPEISSNQITLLDSKSGKRLWVWKDLIREKELIDFSRGNIYNFGNLLLYHVGPRSYCIDVRNGQTVWKQTNPYSGFPNMKAIGNTYFTSGTPREIFDQSIQEPWVYKGDLRTGNQVKVVKPNYDSTYYKEDLGYKLNKGFLAEVAPVVHQGDTLLILTYNQSNPLRYKFNGYVCLYNLSKQRWIYERKKVDISADEGFNTSWLILRGEKMYNIMNNWLVCTNWQTGATVWAKPFPSFAQTPFLVENDKYLVAISTDSRLYLLNPDTGEIIWEHRETVGAADFYYDSGILYYLTDRLCAREIPSGKKLWNIKSDTNELIDGFFWVFVTGLPGKNGEKGRIFTRTGYHTYCFEAIK